MLIYLQMIPDEAGRGKFEEIYLRYREMMFRIADRILHNAYDAEDAVHQSFLKLIDILDKVGEADSPQTKSLLAVITERTAIDMLRKRNRERTISAEHLPEQEDELRLEETVPAQLDVAAAIAALPPRYREVLLLRYDCGFSAREIADICSMNEENVRKTIQRAKAKLKSVLTDGREAL